MNSRLYHRSTVSKHRPQAAAAKLLVERVGEGLYVYIRRSMSGRSSESGSVLIYPLGYQNVLESPCPRGQRTVLNPLVVHQRFVVRVGYAYRKSISRHLDYLFRRKMFCGRLARFTLGYLPVLAEAALELHPKAPTESIFAPG